MNFLKRFFSQKNNQFSYDILNNWSDVVKTVDKFGFAVIRLFDDTDKTINTIERESELLLDKIKNDNNIDSFLAVGRIDSPILRNKSTQIINRYIVPKLNTFLNRYNMEIISGIHLLKPQGKAGILNPHQDSSLVDESIYTSYYFWMPITDISESEGTLEVIPYSHHLQIPFRSLNIPWSLAAHEKELWKYMKKITIPQGCAIIFHSRLIHGSGLNKSKNIRIAVNSFIKPIEADFLHYYSDEELDKQQKLVSYKITPDFFYTEDLMKRPPEKYSIYKEEKNRNRYYTKTNLREIFLMRYNQI